MLLMSQRSDRAFTYVACPGECGHVGVAVFGSPCVEDILVQGHTGIVVVGAVHEQLVAVVDHLAACLESAVDAEVESVDLDVGRYAAVDGGQEVA